MNILGGWYHFGQSVEDAMSDAFEKKSKFIARHPLVWITTFCIISAICAIGLINLKVVVDTDKLWTPQNSEAQQNLNFIEDNFGLKPRTGALLFEATEASGGNLISLESFETMWDAHDKVIAAQADNQTFLDICSQRDSNGYCFSVGVLQFFKLNRTVYNHQVKTLTQLRQRLSSPVFPNRTPVPRAQIFGKTIFSATNPPILLECDAMLQAYSILNTDKDQAIAWERKMVKSVDTASSHNVTVYRNAISAFDDELAESITDDHPVMYLMYAIFALMTVFTLSKGASLLETRIGLGITGLALLILAIIAGTGICAGLGVALTSIHTFLPFLVACVGVNNMYLITAAFDSQDPCLSVEERMGRAMRQCGKALLYTALAISVAFYIGSMSRYYALEVFCYYAGTTLFVNYVLQANVFCAAVCLDAHRREGRKWDIFCCVTSPKAEQSVVPYMPAKDTAGDEEEGIPAAGTAATPLDSSVIADPAIAKYMVPTVEAQDGKEGKPIIPSFSSTMTDPTKEAQSMTHLEYFFSELYYPVMAHPAVRMFLVLGFAGLLIANIFGTLQVKQKLENTQILSEDSFVRKYIIAAREHNLFAAEQYSPAELVFHDLPYHNQTVQEEIFRLQADFIADAQHNKPPCVSWLSFYYVWAKALPPVVPFKPVLNSDGYYTDEAKFYTSVKLFLDTSGSSFNSSVRFMPTAEGDDSPSPIRIRTSRIQCFHNNTRGPHNVMSTMDAARELMHSADFSEAKPFLDASSRDSFVFSQSYIKGEGHKIVDDEVLTYLWHTLVGVAAVSVALLKPHSVLMAAVPVGLVAATYTNVIGNMPRWDVELSYNFISIFVIVMTTAVIVNYILQVLQHYHAQPASLPPLERLRRCMVRAGPAVSMSVLTALIAIIPISFGKTYLFKVYFRLFFCTIVYSAGHALLLLPALLPTLSYLCCETCAVDPEGGSESTKAVELTKVAAGEDKVMAFTQEA